MKLTIIQIIQFEIEIVKQVIYKKSNFNKLTQKDKIVQLNWGY
jgi:hypothetical protein